MAKTTKPTPKTAPAKPAPAADAPLQNWLSRPAPDGESDALLRKIFLGLAAAAFVLMFALSLGSGINADDKFQNDYSTKLVNYYATFGKDTSALNIKEGNMHLYGGFFEIVTGFANKALGFEPTELAYHNLRHASSAIMGWVAILCAALLARLIAGWQAAILTFLLLLCSPRFIGDALMNPKDIPFAAGYMLALYNMAAVLQAMPRPRRWNLVGLAGGLAVALATRAGGLLPFAYLFLFAGLHWLANGFANASASTLSKMQAIGKYALVVLGTAAVGYVLAVLFWPYALQSPLKNPLNALSQFSALEVRIRVLFEGQNLMSDQTPWYYPIKWIWLTIPLASIVGFFGSLALSFRLLKKYNPLFVGLVWFAAIFPVAYVVYKDSVLHDGWRHLTFAYPPLAVAAGLFWNELAAMFSEKKALRYAVFGAMAALLLDAAAFIAANPKMPYVYFIPIEGGTKNAVGNFETDYWGVSVRQGIEWLENQGVLRADMPEKIIIATNMHYAAKQLCAKYGDKVVVKYIKWERRCEDAWDYALYPTRFIDGAALRKGFWPPDNCVHLVEAGGAPILAVLKDNGRNCVLGTAASKLGDWKTAIARLQTEVQNVPDNDIAWLSLANAYMNAGKLDSAAICTHKSLEISPGDSQATNTLGLILMQRNDVNGAKQHFENAIKQSPANAAAWYYLALIAQSQGDNATALNYVIKCVNISPFRPAFELGYGLAQAAGNQSLANQFRAALEQTK